jgi:DEAD/DEAH box helicase domain-containing protein
MIPQDLLSALPFTRERIIDALSGLAYCLHHLAAILLMADPHDIDHCIGDKSGEWFVRSGKDWRHIAESPSSGGPVLTDAFDPTIFLFDAYPGGIGFSELLFREHDRLLEWARRLITSCLCTSGCPSCVGPTLEVGTTAKEGALAILDTIIG